MESSHHETASEVCLGNLLDDIDNIGKIPLSVMVDFSPFIQQYSSLISSLFVENRLSNWNEKICLLCFSFLKLLYILVINLVSEVSFASIFPILFLALSVSLNEVLLCCAGVFTSCISGVLLKKFLPVSIPCHIFLM